MSADKRVGRGGSGWDVWDDAARALRGAEEVRGGYLRHPQPERAARLAPNMGGVCLTARAPFQRPMGRRFLYGLRLWLCDRLGTWT